MCVCLNNWLNEAIAGQEGRKEVSHGAAVSEQTARGEESLAPMFTQH